MKKSAFTLIELLVVISIIAVLAGIALPVFSKALERGHAVQDLSNLRQIGIGTTAYLQDYNDLIFSSAANSTPGSAGTSGAAGTIWCEVLYGKYITNWNIFKSPFDPRPFGTAPDSGGTQMPVSYAINQNIFNQTPASSGSSTTSFNGNTTTYTSPSLLFYVAPCYTGVPTSAASWKGMGNTVSVLTSTAPTLGTHSAGAYINVLYADVHTGQIPFAHTGGFTDTTSTAGIASWQPVHP